MNTIKPVSLMALGFALLAPNLNNASGAEPTAGDPSRPPNAVVPTTASGQGALESDQWVTFAEINRQLDPGGDLIIHLMTDEWLETLSARVASLRDSLEVLPKESWSPNASFYDGLRTVAQGIHVSGIEGLGGVGFSSAPIQGDLQRSKLVLAQKPGTDDGLLWNMFGREAHALDSLDLLPRTTALAIVSDLDGMRAWNVFREVVSNSGSAGAASGLRDWLGSFEHATGLPWTNVLASFAGELGIILTLDDSRSVKLGSADHQLQMPEPGFVVVLKVKDETIFKIVSVALSLNPGAKAEMRESPGVKMCVMPEERLAQVPMRFTVATGGGYLFAASSPELVQAVVDARSGTTSRISQSSAFKALRQALPAAGNQIIYIDRRFWEAAREIQTKAAHDNVETAAPLAMFESLVPAGEPTAQLFIGGRAPAGWQGVSVAVRTPHGGQRAVEELVTFALHYRDADGVPEDLPKAAALLAKAVLRGSARAAYDLGVLYYHDMIPPDPAHPATKYLELAAQQNYAPAITMLGSLERDPAKAMEFWSRAAALKDPWAEYMMGATYLRLAQGRSTSLRQAVYWLKQARQHGVEPVQGLIDGVISLLPNGEKEPTTDEISEWLKTGLKLPPTAIK